MVQPSVRKQHNAGYKHKANVRAYYGMFIGEGANNPNNSAAAAFQQQVGASFAQHMAGKGGRGPPMGMFATPPLLLELPW